jgi:hypothetical protein
LLNLPDIFIDPTGKSFVNLATRLRKWFGIGTRLASSARQGTASSNPAGKPDYITCRTALNMTIRISVRMNTPKPSASIVITITKLDEVVAKA